MLDAAREVVEFTGGRSRADLDRDRMLVHALVRCPEIIGEAAAHVTAERRAREPAVPWADVVGMRHKVIHEYFRVDLDIVWDTAARDVPMLIGALETILSENE